MMMAGVEAAEGPTRMVAAAGAAIRTTTTRVAPEVAVVAAAEAGADTTGAVSVKTVLQLAAGHAAVWQRQ
jgi:hypothetical protein